VHDQDLTTSTGTQTTELQLQMGPNPAGDELMIKTHGFRCREIAVFDLSGKKVLVVIPQKQELILDISTLPQGMYLLRFCGDEGVIMKKVVKK
jgi:hypothetical protein